MAMSEPQRRKAMNEAVFRELNEQIKAIHTRFALQEAREPLDVVCECDRADCIKRLEVSVDVYERVRKESACFFVAPGHEDPAVEDIVDSAGNYVIVRKHPGDPQRIAEQTDPRQ
ncbi:MAG: hypothetical protein JOZ73_02565 [Solirubrobacterales bacterium]|nr:hypothetical protein [Solirubrobacterales bacterium]